MITGFNVSSGSPMSSTSVFSRIFKSIALTSDGEGSVSEREEDWEDSWKNVWDNSFDSLGR